MYRVGNVFGIIFILNRVYSSDLWPKGVLHYSISAKDYDVHSQDLISATLAEVEKELCVKFFHTPPQRNGSNSASDKVLFISNPDKRKDCPPVKYNFSGPVVDMAIGYKCMNRNEIARITVDMLRASILQNDEPVNSFDLVKTFQKQDLENSSKLLSEYDRYYINLFYHEECNSLTARVQDKPSLRSAEDQQAFEAYYANIIWPLGIVMYSVNPQLMDTKEHRSLKEAMNAIESESCVVFRYWNGTEPLDSKALITFDKEGDDVPHYGYVQGNQTVSLHSMLTGARGHSAHTIALLLRALGMPMMSNRHDRDNFLEIKWKYVQKGKEHLLEKDPRSAWPPQIAYNYRSASHAPGNYYCTAECSVGAAVVNPTHDYLWQVLRTLGHRSDLAAVDKEMLALMYSCQCKKRQAN